MRELTELIERDEPAWPEIEAAVAAAPYPVVVLPADPRRADEELVRLQVTTRSWLGAVVHRSGGLVIDHGWLRVFGSGDEEHQLAGLGRMNDGVTGRVVVGQDVLGGRFAWTPPAIWYHAPDTLEWEDCELGYGEWLAAMIGGAATGFYEHLRWPDWRREVQACRLDQILDVYPPPWSQEGADIGAASRRAVPAYRWKQRSGWAGTGAKPRERWSR